MGAGLLAIPTLTDRVSAYARLQNADLPLDEATLARYAQWSRFDPRLGEIWIDRMRTEWRELRPVRLHEELINQPWPQAAGVLLDQLILFGELKTGERRSLRAFRDIALAGISPAQGELFFIGLWALASPRSCDDATMPLIPYARWGYYGRDILINKAVQFPERLATSVSPEHRRLVRDQLIREGSRITVEEYQQRLAAPISPRVAQLDLQRDSRFTARGRTRARFYVPVRKKRESGSATRSALTRRRQNPS